MSGNSNSNQGKGKNHPKTHLCLALNFARYRFIEVLRYIKENDSITERNWLSQVSEFKDLEKLKCANENQQKFVDELGIYLPFIKTEYDKLDELKMILLFTKQLRELRNYYSHAKHKSIILKCDKNNDDEKFMNRFCNLYAEAISYVSEKTDEGYIKDDFGHLKLKKERTAYDKELSENILCFISKTKPDFKENEYSLFFKSQYGYEFTEKGAMFLASLFLDKKEATEFLGGMTGFKKTEGKKFKATRDVFTYYSGKVIFDKMDTSNKDVSLFFNMVSYINKKPACIPAKEGEEIRQKDLFGHFALRYLLKEENDIKIRQYTGKKINKKPPKEIQTKNNEKIIVSYLDDEKIYSDELQNKFFTTGNNIYFDYNGLKGELGFKALSQLVFAKLLKSEGRYNTIYKDVKEQLSGYISQYTDILGNIINGKINSNDDLKDYLNGKIVYICQIPNAIKNGLENKGIESENEFINRVIKRLENKIKNCEERLKKVSEERIYDIVTFILHDFMDWIGKDSGKPGKALYEKLHSKLTFYGRYREELLKTLRDKNWNYESHIIYKALKEKDLRDVYRIYLTELKKQCELDKKNIENKPTNLFHIAKEIGNKIGLIQKSFESKSTKIEERTSSAKDIASMILDKPIPIPDNLIKDTIINKIVINKDDKQINRLATLIDIYLPGKGFDIKRDDKTKNSMLPEYYYNLEEKYPDLKVQKKIRLFKTNDKILRLIIVEYSKGFIKDKVKLILPDERPVTELYNSEATMAFFDRKIKFRFDKYNKVKRLLYDKRVETIVNHHIDKSVYPIIIFSDDTSTSFIIDEEKKNFKDSQKHLISAALDFEERFWKEGKHDFNILLKKYTSKTYINHRSILKEANIKDDIVNFRNLALHNSVPKTKDYFKEEIIKYNSYIK